MSELGCTFYRGPSLLTGDPIVAIATGLEGGSLNPKTGPMVQTWILRPELPPMEAKRQNLDDAICGDCKLRGEGGHGSVCYVATWLGPTNVWKAYQRGAYVDATWRELAALVEGADIRVSAYGDPAAVPVEVWRTLLRTAAGWVGYTHQWTRCDRRLQTFLMASVDTVDEYHAATAAGWRAFRMRASTDPLLRGEFVCPASNEAGHRTTCQRCQLCRGTASPARSVAIVAHGMSSSLANFYRARRDAEAVAC